MSGCWEQVAQWPGGTVTASTTTAGPDSGTVLAATPAGLHLSADQGQSWRWIALGPDPVVEALVASPMFEVDRTLLVGTSSGLYRSGDGGRTWHQVVSGSPVPTIVLAGDFDRSGLAFAGTEADGLLRSDDGGRTWSGASAGLLDLSVTALALSPRFARDRTAFVGTTGGLYRSRNGGRAWRLVDHGGRSAVQAVLASPTFAEDGLVVIGTERDGLFRSDDGGQSWSAVASLAARSITALTCSPPSGQAPLLAAGTADGVALSSDGGRTWRSLAPELGPILSLAFVRSGDGRDLLLAGAIDGGVVCCEPGSGACWPANDGLAGRAVVGLALSPDVQRHPLIAVASLDGGVTVSTDGGTTWTAGLEGATATSVAIAGASGRRTLLATTPSSLYRSVDTGGSWEQVAMPDARDPGLSSLAVSGGAVGPASVVLASGRRQPWLSLDGGETWRPIPPPGGSRAEIVGAAASPALARDRALFVAARATHAAEGQAGAPGLDLWYSADLGEHWTRWLSVPNATLMPLAVPPTGPAESAILAGLPGRVARPLVAAQEIRGHERRPIWQEARIGDPQVQVTAIAPSPEVRRDRTIFAAADPVVYVSRDGGASFAAWDHGLDVPLVTALAVAIGPEGNRVVYALGLGGTLWRRTDE